MQIICQNWKEHLRYERNYGLMGTDMNVAAHHVMFLTLFSAKSKCTISFHFMKIPSTSNKDPQNVPNRLKDECKLFRVHFMFKLKVELIVCSVCYIAGNCSLKTEILHLKKVEIPIFRPHFR